MLGNSAGIDIDDWLCGVICVAGWAGLQPLPDKEISRARDGAPVNAQRLETLACDNTKPRLVSQICCLATSRQFVKSGVDLFRFEIWVWSLAF